MIVIRPVHPDDLDQLLALANLTGFGLTTLPRDRKLLQERIIDSQRGFASLDDPRPRGDAFLFVLEDLKTGQVGGTCGLVAKVGGFEPFYGYKIEMEPHHSEQLKVHKDVPYLKLVEEHNGPCEIGSLFLAPDFRGGGNGRLLSLSRFLFLAEHGARMDPTVIAEMRGVIDEHGGSPFWDAVGRHFFDIDFPTADYLSVVSKKFIAELMPRHPIYIPLLPPAAQAVIGQVHEQTRPALKILEDEGFKRNGVVDIFEAGPCVSCPREQIRAVRDCRKVRVKAIMDGEVEGVQAVVAAFDPRNGAMRAVKCAVRAEADGVTMPDEAALALHVRVGGEVRWVGMKSEIRSPKSE